MPAAAVIPAPIAYIKVVAVKKLVVGSRVRTGCTPRGVATRSDLFFGSAPGFLNRMPGAAETFTLKKLECLKQAQQPE